jgi:hypothetical protein
MRNIRNAKVCLVVLVLWAATGAKPAFSMGGEYGPGDPARAVSNLKWPAGVKELVNAQNRIGGYWVNSSDWFHFAGDTNALNTFLERYAQLKDTPLSVVLMVGKPRAGLGNTKGVAADWQLSVVDNTWTRVNEREKAPPATAYTVTVTIWLGGQVDLEQLKVPANIEVRSGGQIESFVEKHKAIMQPASENILRSTNLISRPVSPATENQMPKDAIQKILELKLTEPEREAIVKSAIVARRQYSQELIQGPAIPQPLWGEPISKLKPIRVVDDGLHVMIVLHEDVFQEEGLYVVNPISSISPGHGRKYEVWEQLPVPGDNGFSGQLYVYRLRKVNKAN